MPLLLVGVGHVFRIEEALKALIEEERPAVVALELDRDRYGALIQRARTGAAPKPGPNVPRSYRFLARFQEDVAASLGTEVGQEMLAAVQAAQAVGSRLALVDRSAQESVERLWAEMTLREKLKLLGSLIAAKFSRRRAPSVEDEIARYQKDPSSYLKEVERQFPTIARVLIHERNELMARRLRDLCAGGEPVVAVVGDGHVEGMAKLLADLNPRLVRLSTLRAPRAPLAWNRSPGGDRVGFSFETRSPEDSFRKAP